MGGHRRPTGGIAPGGLPLGLGLMRRVVWIAIGAVGGIYAYRRGQQALLDARERGVILSAQQVGLSAVAAMSGARALAASAAAAVSAPPPDEPGSAAARVLARSTRPPHSDTTSKESVSGLR